MMFIDKITQLTNLRQLSYNFNLIQLFIITNIEIIILLKIY